MATNSSGIRFTGMVTGIDFDQLIDAMLELKRQPITRLETEVQKLDLRSGLWNDIKSRLTSLQSTVDTLVDKTTAVPFATTSDDETIVTATASGNAVAGTYNVTVSQLATSTRVASGYAAAGAVGIGAAVSAAATLENSNMGIAVTDGDFTLNGVSISVAVDVDSLTDVVDRINASAAGVTASYNATSDKLELTSTSPMAVGSSGDTSNFLTASGLVGAAESYSAPNYSRESTFHLGRMRTSSDLEDDNLHVSLSATSGSFTVNGTSISWDSTTDSLTEVLNRINRADAAVQAYYDPLTDRAVLVNDDTGARSLALQDVTGNLLDALGLLESGANADSAVTLGQNASLTVAGMNNGNPITSASNTVTNAVPGTSLQLVSADATKTVSVKVEPDASVLKDNINAFVAAYNSTVSLLTTRLTEEAVEGTTQGLMRGDSTAFSVRSTLVSRATAAVDGLPSSLRMLAQMGISLESDGTLTVDDGDLEAAILDDADGVLGVFFNDEDNDNVVDDGEGGIAVSLDEELDDWLSTSLVAIGGNSVPDGLVTRQPSLLSLRKNDLNSRMAELEERISREGDALRRRFVALEQQVASLQQRLGAQTGVGTFSNTTA